MDIPHGSDGTFPREGPWLGKAALAAAGLMVGVALGMSISPWAVSPPMDTAAMPAVPTVVPAAALVSPADAMQTASMVLVAPSSGAPAEVQGMELCWGGIDPVTC